MVFFYFLKKCVEHTPHISEYGQKKISQIDWEMTSQMSTVQVYHGVHVTGQILYVTL